MKFLSIDIETTGLDPHNNQILEFGAIAIDTSYPTVPYIAEFRAVFIHQELTGNPIALTMNSKLIDDIGFVLKSKEFDFAITELAEANESHRQIRALQVLELEERIEQLGKDAHYKDMHISTLEEFKSEAIVFLTGIRADCPHEWEELDRVIQIAKDY